MVSEMVPIVAKMIRAVQRISETAGTLMNLKAKK
jgi:hypothetical protein